MDSETCQDCQKLNFERIGRCGPMTNSSAQPGVSRSLTTICQNANRCHLCGLIWSRLENWLNSSEAQGCTDIDYEGSAVSFFAFRVGADGSGVNAPRQVNQLRIQLKVMDKLLSKPGLYRKIWWPMLYFQRSSLNPPSVTAICSQPDLQAWAIDEEDAFLARVRPPKADTRLFRKWRKCCDVAHSGKCDQPYAGKRPTWIRLIDVETRCIVETMTEETSWVTLSYVWGGAKVLKLLKDNISSFLEPNSLNEHLLPLTIANAIQVTRDLGERFIWVDSLCILQDADEDKIEFISQMGSIYACSSITIVALTGRDANAGLPGIRPFPKRKSQVPFQVHETCLIESLDQPRSAITGTSSGYNSTHSEMWFQRGWTYQEGALSQRQLVFTEDEIHWRCRSAVWREESTWEHSADIKIYDPIIPDLAFEISHTPDYFNFSSMYEYTVEAYTLRNLSNQNDGLNAVLGILQAFESRFDESFIWGLPLSNMSDALMWQASSTTKETIRRAHHPIKVPDGSVVEAPFPSWSWVGWTSGITYNVEKGEPLTVAVFYHLDFQSRPQQLAKSRQTQDSYLEKQHYESAWLGTDTVVTVKDLTSNATVFPKCLSLLCSWCSTASFIFYFHADGFPPHIRECGADQDIPLRDYKFFDFPNSDVKDETIAKCIAIGITGEDYIGKRRVHVIMAVCHDGLYYRRGILEIREQRWVALKTRKWECIALG
jgi:hypothetical protein